MPRYRFILPVRAIGGYRLPDGGLATDGVTLTLAADPAYTARLDVIDADNAELAYVRAQQLAESLFGYLALLGEDAAFILDGREGVRARNVEREENPTPADQPPPPFESIGGVITEAGQEYFAALLDPDGSKRRSGAIAVHNAAAVLVPGQERLTQICDLFCRREGVPARLRTALGIIHDAACARECASGFAQSFTALEVLTEHLHPPTVLDAFFQQVTVSNVNPPLYESKDALLAALRGFLMGASLSEGQADRIANYVSMARIASQVDVFLSYITELGIAVTRAEVVRWRSIRGALVHAAAAVDAEQITAMRRCREVVRIAMLEELRRAAAAA